MSGVYMSHNKHQTVFCRVSPFDMDYGVLHTIYTLYDDGSWSRQIEGRPYYRSPANSLRKPRQEYTFGEINDLLKAAEDAVNGNPISKEFAENCLKDNLKRMREKILHMFDTQPNLVMEPLADYYGEGSEYARILRKIKAAQTIIKAK